MSDNLYTIKETAKYLKVHWQTVRNYIVQGKLKAKKVGKQIRIRQVDLQNFLNSKKEKPVHEVEIRFSTKNRKTIEEKLLEIGAKIVYHGHIIDHWFVPQNIKNIAHKDRFYESAKGYSIRIREQDNGYTGKISTSMEVKKLAFPPDHKVCLEEEMDVEDYNTARNFLRLIDQKEMSVLDKDRLVYKYNDIKIVIDDIKNFKTGVELEIITDKDPKNEIAKLKSVAKEIGLDLKNEITDKSVTFLYMQKFAWF